MSYGGALQSLMAEVWMLLSPEGRLLTLWLSDVTIGACRGLLMDCVFDPEGIYWASRVRPCFPRLFVPSCHLPFGMSGIATHPCQPAGATGRLGTPFTALEGSWAVVRGHVRGY